MNWGKFSSLRGYALLTAVMALPTLSGCDRIGNLTPQQHIQRAKDFQDKGDLKSSIIELKSALQSRPDDAETRWLLGEIYVKSGQGSNAEKELVRAQKLGIGVESIKVPLGQALLLQQEYARALNEVKPEQQTSKINSAKIFAIHGDALLGLGRLDEGCAKFAQSLEISAEYVPTYWGLAKCAVAKKDLGQARTRIDTALKLDKKNVNTWLLLGDLELLSNNMQNAKNAYDSALKVNPNSVEALNSRAANEINLKQFDAARKDISAARKIQSANVTTLYLQALLEFRQGKYSEARDAVQEALKLAPDRPQSVLLSGAIAFALGAYEQAESTLAKVLTHFPGDVFTRKLLVTTFLKTKQWTKALNTLKPLLEQETQDAQAMALAGEAYLQANDSAKATEYFEKAVAIDAKNPVLRTELAVSRLSGGESARAFVDLEAASTLDGSQFMADSVLIMTRLNRKEFDQALQAIATLDKKMPNSPVTYNLKGVALIGKKNLVEARHSFERALALQSTFSSAALNLAQVDLLEKNPQAARKRLEGVLEYDKNNIPALLALAQVAQSSGKESEFVSRLEQATKANPSELRASQLLIAHYLEKKNSARALAVAREAQTANPQDVSALDLLGVTQLAVGGKADALISYEKLVARLPQSPLAHFNLAKVQAAMRNVSAAKASLNKALELDPKFIDAEVALVSLEADAGRHAEALRIAKGIQGKYPAQPLGFLLEGDLSMANKQYREAAVAYEKALGIGTQGEIAVKLHGALSAAGTRNEANAKLLQWLQGHPAEMQTREYLAESYLKAGQNKQAIEQYQLIVQKEPKRVLALNNLAGLYQLEKDKRALSVAEQAYKLAPENVAILDTLGWVETEQGNVQRAVELLGLAVTRAPNAAVIRYHYAVALRQSGAKEKAKNEMEKALVSGEAFPQREQAKVLLKSW